MYYVLLKNNRVDYDSLNEAVFCTFKRRKTVLKNKSEIFEKDFYMNERRNTAWKSFLKKNKVEQFDFEDVMNLITRILRPVYLQLCD